VTAQPPSDDPGSGTGSDGASTLDLSGRCVGSSYLLIRPIGQGATGTVWRGVDRSSGEQVAVKLLHESLLRQPKLVTRFVQERTILLMLRHRNVVRVRDLFSVGESLGLVMDLVAGGSLRDHLRDHSTVPAGEAARLAAQVAAALAEAHDLGVIHRDLKPDNILLQTENGRLDTRLTDFGIARVLNTPSITTPHAVVGTPHYMAPEAFHGAPTTPAADVYALGVLLYELVVGCPPYLSDSVADLMRRHVEDSPERRPGIPDALWEVITCCMAKKPRLRPSAAELIADLSAVARAAADVPALPHPAPRPVPPPAGSAAAEAPSVDDPGGSEDAGGIDGAGIDDAGIEDAGIEDAGIEDAGIEDAGIEDAGIDVPGPRTGPPASVELRPVVEHPSLAGSPHPPPQPRNQPAAWRWARPWVIVALVSGSMVATGVVTSLWHLRHGIGGSDILTVAEPADQRAEQPRAVPSVNSSAVVTVNASAPPARPTARASIVVARATSKPARTVATTADDAEPTKEARPVGPWQCREAIQFSFSDPLLAKPCHAVGDSVQVNGQIVAPAGARVTITLSLRDTVTGRTAAGPHTCAVMVFTDRGQSHDCGPVRLAVPRGHRYAAVIDWRYLRQDTSTRGTATGPEFSW
jgi:serine/threonine-protein kinase